MSSSGNEASMLFDDATATMGDDATANATMGGEILPTPKRSNVATDMDESNTSSHDKSNKPDPRSKGGGSNGGDATSA